MSGRRSSGRGVRVVTSRLMARVRSLPARGGWRRWVAALSPLSWGATRRLDVRRGDRPYERHVLTLDPGRPRERAQEAPPAGGPLLEGELR
ncbi:hypothetical protein [Ornithinimicrobium cerasi]|uniref:hypothetical protein n=1 Tax=Ornithinimicrobium cerasi TaxID=2248773 RepID=UPI00137B64F1|nr:hypothetical protein [Ornithinimicrobium cerasi]